jgi:hypothetical protein
MAQGAIAQGKMINQLIGAGTELATSTIKSLEPRQLEKDIKLAKKHGLI